MRRLLALLFVVTTAHATDRYIATNGNNSAAGTIGAPWLTWQKFVDAGSGGDRVFFRGGTYTYIMDEQQTGQIPSGSNLGAGATIVSAFPGETVIHKPQSAGNFPVLIRYGANIIFTNMTWDCTNGYFGWKVTDSGNSIRFIDCTISNVPRSHGILISKGSGSIIKKVEVIRCGFYNFAYLKQASDNDLHGGYISTSSNLFDGCLFRGHDLAGWGIQVYSEGAAPTGNIFRNNTVWPLVNQGHDGIILGSGDDNSAYNNTLLDTAVSLRVEGGSNRALLANNTIYHTGTGIEVGSSGVDTDTVIDNNLISSTTSSGTADVHLYNGAVNTVVRNNLAETFNNSGSGTATANNLFGAQFDPQFVSAPSDLRIGATSAALNAGRTETAFSTDFEGTSRPQGNAWDIGMDERVEGVMLPLVNISSFSQFAYEEGSVDGVFTLTRDTSSGTLTVNYRLTGTAVNGTDYATLATNVTFAAGQLSTNVIVNPTDDATDEADKTIILDLWPNGAVYTLGTPTNATMTQLDNDLPPPPPPPPPPPVGDTNNASGGGSVLPRRRADIDAIEAVERAVATIRSELSTSIPDIVRSVNYRFDSIYREQTNTNAQLKLIKAKLGIP